MNVSISKIMRAVATTGGRQLVSGVLNLVIIVVIGRVLGTAGAGSYAVALLLPSMLTQLLNFGLSASMVYLVSSKQVTLANAWAATRDIAVLLMVIGLCVGAAVVAFGSENILPNVGALGLLIALLSFPFSYAVTFMIGFFQTQQDFATYNRLFLTQPIVTTIAIGTLAVFELLTLQTALISLIPAHAIAFLYGLKVIRRHIPENPTPDSKSVYLKKAFNYGIKVHVNNNVAFVNRRMDLFLVNLMIGPDASGIYAIAARLVEQLWIFSTAVATVLFPKLSSMEANSLDRQKLTELMSRTTLWLTLIASGVLAVLTQPLLLIVFGPDFLPAATIVFLLLPGVVLRSLSRILASDFAARGRVELNLALGSLILFVNLIGNLILIPKFGVAGAAIATTIAYTSTAVLRLLLQKWMTGLSFTRTLLPQSGDLRMVRDFIKQRRKS